MMKRMLFCLCLVMSACGGGTEQAPVSAPPVESPKPAKVVVFMGDSITRLWIGGIPGQPPPFDAAVADPMLDKLLPGVIDVGIGGQTTPSMLTRFSADVLSNHPDVVIILGGTNDLRADPLAGTDSIAAMADKAAASGARVIIGTIPPGALWTSSVVLTQADTDTEIRRFNGQLRLLANAYEYTLVDYYAALSLNGSQNGALFTPDLIHPNKAGYVAMWNALKPALAQLGVN